MTVQLLTLMVLLVAFGAEIGWLMAEPPASLRSLGRGGVTPELPARRGADISIG